MAELSESSNQNAAGIGTSTPGQLPQLSAVKEEIPETVGIGPQLSAVKKEIPETVGIGPQLSAVKIEIPETVGIGPDFSKGPPANVDAVTIAQSAGHVQTDQADPTLQIVQHAQDSSDIPAPSENREFWTSWNIDVPLSSDKDEELAEDMVRVSSSYLHSNATSHQWALGGMPTNEPHDIIFVP